MGATAAQAAPVVPTITNPTFDKTAAGGADAVELSFNWSVPDSAHSGDTFSIKLPEEVRARSTADFTLKTPGGETAADAVWSGDTVTFTLAPFVDTNDNINGTAYFSIGWDREHVDMNAAKDFTLRFSGSQPFTLPLTLIPDGPIGDGQSLSKAGWWLSDDQGASSSENQLAWVVYLDTGTATPVDAPVVIRDTPGPGSKVNVDTVEGFVDGQPLSTERYTVEQNGTSGVTIELTGNYPGDTAVYDGENIYFTYSSDLLPGENGVFSNSAVVTEGSNDPEVVSSTVKRDGAGGDGDGDRDALVPEQPIVNQATCDAETGQASEPTVELPQTSDITYTMSGNVEMGETVTITATAGANFVLEESDGWVLSEDKRSATTQLTFDVLDCESAVRWVAPEHPSVSQATCADDGIFSGPSLVLPEDGDVVYSVSGEPIQGTSVKVTATASEGVALLESDGWVLSDDDASATTTVVYDEVSCDVVGVPEGKVEDVQPEAAELAETGADSILLNVAATLGMLLVAGGAFLARRRRV